RLPADPVRAAEQSGLVSRDRSRIHRAHPAPQLPPGSKPALEAADHERELRSLPHCRHLRRVRLGHQRTVRDRDRRDRGPGAHLGHRVARVRVQGKAGRPQAPAAAGGAVPPALGLAHVVRGDVVADVPRVVRAAPGEAPRWRPPDAPTAPYKSLQRSPAAIRPGAPISLPVHDTEGAPRERRVVASRACRRLRSSGVAPERPLMRGRRRLCAVVLLLLLASCSLPRPTAGLSIAGTNVPGSREGSYCQTGGCSGVCGDSLAPVAPLTPVRAASPVRLDFSAGAEVDRIHGDIWEGETQTGRPAESFELRGSDRSYTSQLMRDGRYYLLISLGWSRVTDHGDTSVAFAVELTPP